MEEANKTENTATGLTEDALSLTDKDIAGKIRDILAAKYGLIPTEEPVLHVAVANAAAIDYIIGVLRQYHKRQNDDIHIAQQDFRDSLSDTLDYFNRHLVNTIKKAVAETCDNQIEQFRIVSEKQTLQLQHLIDNRPAVGAPEVQLKRENSSELLSFGINWLHVGTAAMTGAIMALLAALIVL